MRKVVICFLLVLIGALIVNVYAASSDSNSDFINRREVSTSGDSNIEIQTISPWVSGAKVEIELDDVDIDKAYLVIDIEVVESINNTEAVMHFGVNETVIEGPDDVSIHGNPTNVQKMWGNWFFVPQGRTALYISVDDYLTDTNTLNKFGIYFDTGVSGRSVKMNVWGLYLSNELDQIETENLITLNGINFDETTHIVDDSSIIAVGTTVKFYNNNESKWEFDAAEIHDDWENALKIHVKSESEGGIATHDPDGYGFVTFDFGNDTIVPSQNNGIALQVYALSGETYFKIFFEDINGHIFTPNIPGTGPTESTVGFKFGQESIASTQAGFYNAVYLPEDTAGTIYIPFTNLIQVNRFLGENLTTTPEIEIGQICKLHIGLDMEYGLGRSLAIGSMVYVNPVTGELNSIIKTSDLGSQELNIDDVTSGTIVMINETGNQLENFILSKLDVSETPGFIPENDLSELNTVIDIVESLDRRQYTDESWQNVQDELLNAINIRDYQELYNQNDIETAANNLYLTYVRLDKIEQTSNLTLWIVLGSSFSGLVILGVLGFLIIRKKRGVVI